MKILDAGVFEYLLGELLRIISEKGKLMESKSVDKNKIALREVVYAEHLVW